MKIICSGFYGHRNAGDEAIARSLVRYLERPFQNVTTCFATEISTEQASRIAESDEFYASHKLISVYDIDAVKEPDIVIVGGGDLSPVYGLTQVMHARESGRCTMIARLGTSAKDDFLKGGQPSVDVVRDVMRLFGHISVRDRISHGVLGSLGITPHLGADLALDYPLEEAPPPVDGDYCVVVARSVRDGDVERQTRVAKEAIKAIKREMEHVVLLPFCDGDASYGEYLSKEMDGVIFKKDIWTSPGQLAYTISNAKYVVSLGRLHALVFAIGNRVPCFGVTYPWLSAYDKINAFMQHSGLPGRVADWGLDPSQIGAMIHEGLRGTPADQEIVNIYSGYQKGLLLEALCPVWSAMKVEHGLGLERGMKAGEFKIEDYDDSYFFGARVFRAGEEFRVYHPTRGDWEGWDVIRDLVLRTTKCKTLLDAGCGRGWFVRRMRGAGVMAEGIDLSKAAWEHCAPGVKEHIKLGTFSDIANRRFDVVTAFDVMEHVYAEELPDVIKAMKGAAGRFIVLNICAAPNDEPEYTIRRRKPIPPELEWLAVSGHVTIRHRAWWKARLEDDDWESAEDLVDQWFSHPKFDFPSWKRHNVIILRRKGAK